MKSNRPSPTAACQPASGTSWRKSPRCSALPNAPKDWPRGTNSLCSTPPAPSRAPLRKASGTRKGARRNANQRRGKKRVAGGNPFPRPTWPPRYPRSRAHGRIRFPLDQPGVVSAEEVIGSRLRFFGQHAIRLTYTQVLENLAAAGTLAEAARQRLAGGIARTVRHGRRGTFRRTISEACNIPPTPPCKHYANWPCARPQAGSIVSRLARDRARASTNCGARWRTCFTSTNGTVSPRSEKLCATCGKPPVDLPDFLPMLGELADAPPALLEAMRTLPLSPDQLEAATARHSLDEFHRAERWLARCDGRVITRHMQEAARLQRREVWIKTRRSIRAEVRRRFRENVNLSSLPAAQLTAEQKLFKKNYAAGRRVTRARVRQVDALQVDPRHGRPRNPGRWCAT